MAPNLGKPSFDDYPFDPKADLRVLSDLDRLRAIQDRSLARYLFELWFHLVDPTPREVEAAQREAEETDLALLESMTDKAMDGTFGPEGVSLAKRVVQPHRNAYTMRRLRWALSNLGDRRRSG